MTRISTQQMARNVLLNINKAKTDINKYSQEVSTGVKVRNPSDSSYSGTIAQLNSTLERSGIYQQRISRVESSFAMQDSILSQANDLLLRAKEIATQGANESNSSENRAALSEEVFQIRDQLVQLANSTYEGSYLYSGYVTDTPPYSATTYTNGSGPGLERYVYLSADGHDQTRTVRISDNLTVRENTAGEDIFDGGLQALERLGRALAGYRTDPDAVNGSNVATPTAPDGTGTAYDLTLKADITEQTNDILNSIELLDMARENDVIDERNNLAGRMKRLDSTRQVLELADTSLKDYLSKLQDAEIVESASELSLSQTALEASYSVTSRVLSLSIMNYL